MGKLTKLVNLVETFLQVFPDEYWSKLFKHRLQEDNEMNNLATCIFSDIFQYVHKPDPEHKTTQVLVFCVVPKISECWDTILASYCILLYHKFGFHYSPSQIANLILEVMVVGLKGKLNGMFQPEKIENFDRTVLEYLMQVKEGTRQNKFFSDPEGALCNILDMVEELGVKSGSCKRGFYDEAKKSITENLNKPEYKQALQQELDLLIESE